MPGLRQLLCTSFCVAVVFYGAPAVAEFRVFRLKIVNAETGTDREVISRLDDIQYAGYFLKKRAESISIEQTWMCFERNDYAGTLCPAPDQAAQRLDRNPASAPR